VANCVWHWEEFQQANGWFLSRRERISTVEVADFRAVSFVGWVPLAEGPRLRDLPTLNQPASGSLLGGSLANHKSGRPLCI